MVPYIQICSPLYFQAVAKISSTSVKTSKRTDSSIGKSTSELRYAFYPCNVMEILVVFAEPCSVCWMVICLVTRVLWRRHDYQKITNCV